MKSLVFLIATVLFGVNLCFGAEFGPKLSRADLETIYKGDNLVKGDLLLWEPDEKVHFELRCALAFEEVAPVFVPTSSPLEYKYQLNSEISAQFREVHLKGVKLSDLYLFFESSMKRWGHNGDQPSGIRARYGEGAIEGGYNWMVRLPREAFNLNGDTVRTIGGTTSEGYGKFENEWWGDVILKVDIMKAKVSEFQLELYKESRLIHYIGLAEPEVSCRSKPSDFWPKYGGYGIGYGAF